MTKLFLNLHIFDGEGGGEGAPAAEGTANPEAEIQEAPKGKKAKNPLADVQYGKTPESKEETPSEKIPSNPETVDPEQRKKDFEQYLKDNKDLDSERIQGIINKRFAETKGLEEKLDSMNPILEALKSKYGTDDVAELTKLMQNDDELVAERARENGLTLEQQRNLDKLTRENEELRKTDEARRREEHAQEIRSQWIQQAEGVKARYPGFDLGNEINNPDTGERFKDLLARGIDVGTAYEVIHKDDIINNSVAQASQMTQKRIVEDIKARGMRPQENGANTSAPSVISKPDPSKWSKKDREEVSRRVLRGEKIFL